MEAKQGTAFLGGQKVVTQGIQSTTLVDASYPGAIVTVFNFGTTNLATIFADNLGTPLSNPFTSSLVTGDFIFYAANGRYTIQLSGAGMPSTETITDVLLNDPTSSMTVTASAFISSSATPATSGVLRMAASDIGVSFKSSLGGSDLVLTKNGSDAYDINTALVLHGTLSTSGNAIAGGVISGTTGTFSGVVTASSFTGGSGSTFTNLTISGAVGTVLGVTGSVSVGGSLVVTSAITGGSYSGGAISGTTGTFTGAVSATAISGTTGSFSSNVTITGTLAVGGGTALTTTNQTGTGSLVLANGPTMTAPVLGVATATSINGLVITSTTATFTLTAAKTFAVDNSIELAGTDGTKHTFAATAPTGGVLAYGVPKFQQFTANGTFTIPAGVTAVKVTLVGGGGGGGAGGAAGPAGGGGSGGEAIKWLSGLTPGNTIAVTVGTGGGSGAAGNASSIASGTQIITTVTANGGSSGGGGVAGGGFGGPAAAVSTNGDINGAGNPGGNGTTSFSGPGGSTFLGGAGAATGGANGTAAAANTGSGGSGAFTGGGNTGGAGAAGLVIFEWVV